MMTESIFAKMGMPEERPPLQLLQTHLRELTAIERRLEPKHVGRPAIEARIEEAKQAIEAERKGH